jgi:hypothetical protein
MRFANGISVTDEEIALFVENYLIDKLKKMQGNM